MRAIEAGIFNETTKNRMDELDVQKAELEREIAEQELSSVFKITKVQIKQILSQMAEKDLSTSDAQRKLVNTFVNAIYVYDDKLIITFNYSGDDRKVTIDDIEALETFGKKFDCHSQWATIKEPSFVCLTKEGSFSDIRSCQNGRYMPAAYEGV